MSRIRKFAAHVDRTVTAYHEAGHVAAHLLTNLPFRGASIIHRGHSLGRVFVSTSNLWRTFRYRSVAPNFPGSREDAECFSLLSGPVAEALHSTLWDPRAGAGDLDAARLNARELFGVHRGNTAETEAYLSGVAFLAGTVLVKHWALVVDIAEALMCYERISHRHAAKILTKCRRRRRRAHLRPTLNVGDLRKLTESGALPTTLTKCGPGALPEMNGAMSVMSYFSDPADGKREE
jgi:hypothetical protein